MDEAIDLAAEQVINQELDGLNREELEGSWRSLCAMMLLRTANLLHIAHTNRKQNCIQRSTALRWMQSSDAGVITFSAACETLNMDMRRVRDGILAHAETRKPTPINRVSSGLLFGKHLPCHQRPTKSEPCCNGPLYSTT